MNIVDQGMPSHPVTSGCGGWSRSPTVIILTVGIFLSVYCGDIFFNKKNKIKKTLNLNVKYECQISYIKEPKNIIIIISL